MVNTWNTILGFKAWDSMGSTIAGYELVNMIKKSQHINAGKMTVWDEFVTIPNNKAIYISEEQFMFVDTVKGAEALCVHFSIVRTDILIV